MARRRGSNLNFVPAATGNQRQVFESTYVRFGDLGTRGNAFHRYVRAMLARHAGATSVDVSHSSEAGAAQ
jgi:hypothetical protein